MVYNKSMLYPCEVCVPLLVSRSHPKFLHIFTKCILLLVIIIMYTQSKLSESRIDSTLQRIVTVALLKVGTMIPPMKGKFWRYTCPLC